MRLSAVRNVPMHCITSGGKSDACLSRKSLVPVYRRTILACSVRRSLIKNIPCIGGCLSSLCSPYCSTARCPYDDTCLDTCTPLYLREVGERLSPLPCGSAGGCLCAHSYNSKSTVCCPWLSCKPPQAS